MNTHKQIQQIAANDDRLTSKVDFTTICKSKDLNHLQRRQQQRAISNEMMQIAIAYSNIAPMLNSPIPWEAYKWSASTI